MKNMIKVSVIGLITLMPLHSAYCFPSVSNTPFFQDPFINNVIYNKTPMAQLAGTAANIIQVQNSIIVKRWQGIASGELLFELSNPGYIDHAIVKVICPIAKEIQLQTINQDRQHGISLIKVKQIPLQARNDLSLQPNGYHIMLINLKQPIQIGDMVPVTLIFDDGSQKHITAEVSI